MLLVTLSTVSTKKPIFYEPANLGWTKSQLKLFETDILKMQTTSMTSINWCVFLQAIYEMFAMHLIMFIGLI